MSGSGKGMLGVVGISWNESGAGTFPDTAQGQMLNLLKLFLIVVYLCHVFNDVDWTLSLFLPPTPLLLVLSSMLSFVI